VRKYQQYRVWSESLVLVESVYRVSASLPREETYGLISQIRRAAVSVPSNLAEGAGRGTEADFGRFIDMSIGSLNELETMFQITRRLCFLEQIQVEQVIDQIISIRMQLVGLRKKLKPRKKAGS
jgi:four helix bundle protein